MKKHLSAFGGYLIVYEAAVLLGLLVLILAQIPLQMIFSTSKAAEYIGSFLAGGIGSAICFFVAFYRSGHKRGEFNLKALLIPLLLVLAVQQIVAPLLQYMLYVAGSALRLSGAIHILQGYNVTEAADAKMLPKWLTHLCMLLWDAVFFLPPVFLGESAGAKKRQKDRKALHGEGRK